MKILKVVVLFELFCAMCLVVSSCNLSKDKKEVLSGADKNQNLTDAGDDNEEGNDEEQDADQDVGKGNKQSQDAGTPPEGNSGGENTDAGSIESVDAGGAPYDSGVVSSDGGTTGEPDANKFEKCEDFGGMCQQQDQTWELECPEGYFMFSSNSYALCSTDYTKYCCLPNDSPYECASNWDCTDALTNCCSCGKTEEDYTVIPIRIYEDYYKKLCDNGNIQCDECPPGRPGFHVMGVCRNAFCELKFKYPEPAPDSPEFYACTQNSDCTAVQSNCCTCNDTSINSQYVEEWYSWLKTDMNCSKVQCPKMPECTADVWCIFGRCSFTRPADVSHCLWEDCYTNRMCWVDRFGCSYTDIGFDDVSEATPCNSDADCSDYVETKCWKSDGCIMSETEQCKQPGDAQCHKTCSSNDECGPNRKCYKVSRNLNNELEEFGICLDLGW